MSKLYTFNLRQLDGTPLHLSEYVGKVVLIVNVASQCGFTAQYQGLEQLWRDYRDRGLRVLGFPCNQFGGQEPGDADEIARFCSTTYDVTFPILEKIEVNGDNTHPLYVWLKHEMPGLMGIEAIKWNFTKFLIDRAGVVVDRFAPQTSPESLRPVIEKLLNATQAQ